MLDLKSVDTVTEEPVSEELAPEALIDKAGDRTKRVDEETEEEARRQNRDFIERKAEKFPQMMEEHKELLKDLLEKVSRQELSTPQEIEAFLLHPSSGEGIEDNDFRSLVMKAVGKVQPIVDMPQAFERLSDQITNEQAQLWVNEHAGNMAWYQTPEGQTTLAGIRAGVETRIPAVE